MDMKTVAIIGTGLDANVKVTDLGRRVGLLSLSIS